ncbi:cytochrome b5-like heme/steroid binding domain-containing protein [Boletus edulis]|uniref:Cytochrome b5-like heme/steroid binding domain-containing protein n=1 Tax=Boletus edulis BED1 TaxID=1328754 RepID=A0AAD4GL83_BOLED|nr:cytochrome b5-like heme/steroid binding domain-containing protein [Boletus edulis]KAF8450681.1 cytochrome b5-like heme/steroid binding domain-containing protein [Boletus edulis BED1]
MSKVISYAELQTNNTKENLWVAIHGKVYNVTKFIDEHPGGDEVIISEGGKNATEAFEDVGHSDEARGLLPDLLVGELEQGSTPSKAKKASSNPAVHSAVEKGSNMMYFVPLTLLGAYFAWRFYG